MRTWAVGYHDHPVWIDRHVHCDDPSEALRVVSAAMCVPTCELELVEVKTVSEALRARLLKQSGYFEDPVGDYRLWLTWNNRRIYQAWSRKHVLMADDYVFMQGDRDHA